MVFRTVIWLELILGPERSRALVGLDSTPGKSSLRHDRLRRLGFSFVEFANEKIQPSALFAHLVGQHDLGDDVTVVRVGILDVRVRLLQFRLAELDDGS